MTDLAETPPSDEAAAGEGGEVEAVTKGERTRRRLLELAIDRFGSRGYRATSVSEIARSAGLTQAAAYAYFENKEALFRAAVDADASALIDEVAAQAVGVGPRDLIPTVLVFAVAAVPSHPLARRVLEGQEPEEVRRLVELPSLHRFGEILGEELRAAQERGEIRTDFDPSVLGAGLESLVMGLLFSTILMGGAASPRHIDGVVEAFDLMLREST